MLSFTKLLLFFSKLSKKRKPKQTNKPQPRPFERIQNSRAHSRLPQLSVCFGFYFSTCYTRRQIQIRLASVYTAGGNYRLLHGGKSNAAICPTVPTQLPSHCCPDTCSSSAPGAKCFSPSQSCREATVQLCLLAPDVHPCGPTGTAGLCARQPFPNPFCCSTGSCQSSLCPRPRLPPSNSVYTPCWICSACHLQRQCLGPAKTPQIQLSLVPPPASALGQGVLFQRSSQ